MLVGAAFAGLAPAGCGGGSPGPVPAPQLAQPTHDPLAYAPAREEDYVRRATAGLAHVLFAKSPGGIQASVARTEAFRPLIANAAKRANIDPDTLEAIVLLESAGRPDVVAGTDVSAAAGLTQIVAETGQRLLGMHIDLAASRRLSRSIARALALGQRRRVAQLAARRERVDQRFDPAQAVAASVRYLALARARFGRDDLAVESYHMGIGNLDTAVRRYAGDDRSPTAELVRERRLSYARLYFDSTPLAHAAAWSWLSALGDDSATYLWRVFAARDILRRSRSAPAALASEAALQTARNSSEQVLHPPGSTPVFADPGPLRGALGTGSLQALPAAPLLADGIALDPQMGALAAQLHQDPRLYRALRPAALTLLGYLGAQVRQISHVAPLYVTSTARDVRYQSVLAQGDTEAVTGYSLHTTGFAFDLARRYTAPAQAQALQYMLNRLTALNLIAWVREPAAIHVAVAGDARSMLVG